MDIRVPSAMREYAANGNLDCSDVAVSAELGDEASTTLQRAMHAHKHRIMVAHPVQYRVRKDCVEFALERQPFGGHQPRVEAARLRRRNHLFRGIDTDDVRTCGNDFFSGRTLPTTKIENAL